jgi:glycosyltransferase involved in cell wall biosynthesis
MSDRARLPLVTVVTPVFNGETYLRECIDSVRGQTYENWEYVIVNNCSTDGTAQIAQEYVARDGRIRVHHNSRFVGVIANHNIAIQQLSGASKYCKFVEADDWLFPECLERMVELAEEHPSVGIVGCYGLSGAWVKQDGLPYPSTAVPGRQLCRRTLLGGPHVFGSPTSLLLRADLIRGQTGFHNEANIHADTEACYELLQHSDFGFVHQVLIYNRVHEQSVSAQFSEKAQTHLAGNLLVLNKYGPRVLAGEEFRQRLAFQLDEYYRYLAKSVFLLRGRAFWDYHARALATAGAPLNIARLSCALLREAIDILVHPWKTAGKTVRLLRRRLTLGRSEDQERNPFSQLRAVCGDGDRS